MRTNILLIAIAWTSLSCSSKHHHHEHSSNDYAHYYTDYFGDYVIKDKSYGTKTEVKIKGEKRIMTTNAIPNHDTGIFPNEGNPNRISKQNKRYEFPLNPVYTGKAKWVREPGVALNGVKFEPQTAEVVQCETGENYRLEAIQDQFNLGLDFNHAHVQPTGEYHYHGVPTSVVSHASQDEDLVHIGFALDGFPIYYSSSNRYKPSYTLVGGDREGEYCNYENPHHSLDVSVKGHHDGTYGEDFEYVKGHGDLDECNGIEIDGNYVYLVTQEFPYVGRCLMGEFKENQRPSGNRQQGPRGQQGRSGQERPSFAQLLEMMDMDKDNQISKKEAKGPLSESFDRIDSNEDGYITEEELKNMAPPGGQRPQRGRR